MRKSLFLCISLPLLHIHTCNFSFPLFSSRHLSNGIWQLTSSHSFFFFFFPDSAGAPLLLKVKGSKSHESGSAHNFFNYVCVCRRVRVAVQWPRKKFQMPRNLSFNGNFVCVSMRGEVMRTAVLRKQKTHTPQTHIPTSFYIFDPIPYSLQTVFSSCINSLTVWDFNRLTVNTRQAEHLVPRSWEIPSYWEEKASRATFTPHNT